MSAICLQAATSARRVEELTEEGRAAVEGARSDALEASVPQEHLQNAEEQLEALEGTVESLTAQNEALADELVRCQTESAGLAASHEVHEDAIEDLERTLTTIERQVRRCVFEAVSRARVGAAVDC